ncbi:MAG TPA: 50S ribosomal protein L4 [Chitinophagales bacterium]|nr:50S ribosomal protein L4 [Chitinophagales bacterium]HLP52269.1 50S ribosomal protein L4 [Chitinophagales bacterium]
MKVKVISKDGKETGREINLNDEIFGIEPNDHAVYLSVKSYLAAQRQGTHKSKEKWEVARTTKKAFRQKGTGGARRGSMKAPGLKGGGRTFGPKPHLYDLKVNKKVKDLARRSAFTYKAKDGNLIVVEDFQLSTPKTKEFAAFVNGLNLKNTKTVFVVDAADKNTALSARNLPSVYLTEVKGLNIYEIMNCKKLVLSEAAVKSIESNFSKN